MLTRVGIYGGSFNPIHLGHTRLAQSLCRAGVVDEVWLMVSPLNPLKRDRQSDLLPYADRLRMARLATQNMRHVHVSDFESHLPLPSYTLTTLSALRQAFPHTEFVLCVGADNWQHFPEWYHAADIRHDYDIVVYGRHGAAPGFWLYPKNGDPQALASPDFRYYDISSTAIRHAIRTGDRALPSQWLNGRVLRYILRHRLYQ